MKETINEKSILRCTFLARLIIICSAFSSWYLAIFSSMAETSIPSIKLNAAMGEKVGKSWKESKIYQVKQLLTWQ